MDANRLAVLREQLHVTWSLAEHTLADLRDDECQWLPSPDSWTVHRDAAGRWVADWAEPEPDDVAAPSLAWALRHAIWWWSMLLDRCTGAGTLTRQEVLWPGAENSLGTLRSLHDRWQRFLDSLDSEDLNSGELTRFPYTDGRPFAHVLAWANIELMKNVAEMALLRRVARASFCLEVAAPGVVAYCSTSTPAGRDCRR